MPLGDRREGVLPSSAPRVAAQLSQLAGIQFAGISVNFGCLCGQLPSVALFRQAEEVLATAVGRVRWAGAHLATALAGTACLALAAGLTAGAARSAHATTSDSHPSSLLSGVIDRNRASYLTTA